jgi:hypothetical protein
MAHAGMDAAEIYKKSAVTGGLVVVLESDDGKLAGELAVSDRYLVHGLDEDEKDVLTARKNLFEKGIYGKVRISRFDGKNLPYVDSLVSLIVAGDKCRVPREEIMRVLSPLGVALIGKKKIVKEWPSGMKEWTHFMNDAGGNAVSEDEKAGYPRNMRWAASPMWARHHDRQASLSSLVSAAGRLYYVVDRGPAHTPEHTAQWQLEARNAFNGLLLWEKPMKSWVSHKRGFRSGPVQLARLLVADGERVFAAMGLNEPVSVINGDDGQIIRNLDATQKAEEILYTDGLLLVLVAGVTVEHAGGSKANMKKKALVAVNPDNGEMIWRYPKNGFVDIIPRTLAASEGKVVFQKTADTVCLALDNGNETWRVEKVLGQRNTLGGVVL